MFIIGATACTPRSNSEDQAIRDFVRLTNELQVNRAAMIAAARDLEAWGVANKHPMSAEALIGSILLRWLPVHRSTFAETDVSPVAQYQRLETRIATLFADRERLNRELLVRRSTVEPWLKQHASALGSERRGGRTSVVPPGLQSPNRFAAPDLGPNAWVHCGLADFQGQKLCITTEAWCTPEDGTGPDPGGGDEAPLWNFTCVTECYQMPFRCC
jgi:hypothetical protein